MLDFFRIMGLAPPDAMSVRCERRQYLDREGHVTRKEDYTQRMTSWSVLYKALKDAFPVDRCAPPEVQVFDFMDSQTTSLQTVSASSLRSLS